MRRQPSQGERRECKRLLWRNAGRSRQYYNWSNTVSKTGFASRTRGGFLIKIGVSASHRTLGGERPC
jgi:hypothetical protein